MCSPLSPSTSHTHNHLQEDSPDANPEPTQDHATDEEKLASSTNQKWTRHDVEVELTSDPQDFPQPTDFTAFVNENSLPAQSDGERVEGSHIMLLYCLIMSHGFSFHSPALLCIDHLEE